MFVTYFVGWVFRQVKIIQDSLWLVNAVFMSGCIPSTYRHNTIHMVLVYLFPTIFNTHMYAETMI